MAQDPENGEHGGAMDPEVFEGLVVRAMLSVAKRIELERQLAGVERNLAVFPDGVMAEALRRVGVTDTDPDSGSAVMPEQDVTAVPHPRSRVD